MQKSLRSLERNVVTPATAGLFLVSAVTGAMLFLHWQSGMVRDAHEWLGIAFVVVAGWHVARNWRAFMHYLRRCKARLAIVATLAISLAFIALTGSTTAGGGGPSAVLQALSEAPLQVAAPVFRMTPEVAMERLRLAGFETVSVEATLAAIGETAGHRAKDVIEVLVAGEP